MQGETLPLLLETRVLFFSLSYVYICISVWIAVMSLPPHPSFLSLYRAKTFITKFKSPSMYMTTICCDYRCTNVRFGNIKRGRIFL